MPRRQSEQRAAEPRELTDYRYKQLKGCQPTRLIALQPAQDYSADLKCDVIHVDLSNDKKPCRPYTALSYAWGNPEMTHILRCGSSKIKITANLDTALRSLRLSSGNLLLWVDAVCINQADTAEKNLQLPNMKWIYSRADYVVIFLGPGDEGGEESLVFLRELGREIDSAADSTWDRVHPVGIEDAIEDKMESMSEPLGWETLKRFFRRAWFSRRWIIQEAVVALDSLVVCGRTRILWREFMDGIRVLLRRSSLRANIDRDVLDALNRIDSLRLNWILRASNLPGVGIPNILTLLQWFDRFNCQDDRDRLFSLLGITGVIAAEFRVLDHVKDLMDYNRTVADIYTTFATQCLRDSDGYLLLNYAAAFRQSSECSLGLSSWIPDWRVRAKFKPIPPSHFKAGVDSTKPASLNIEGNCLTATGLVVDIICSKLCPEASALAPEDAQDFILQCQEMLLDCNSNYQGETYAFGMTLIAGYAYANPQQDMDEFEDGKPTLEGFFEIAHQAYQEPLREFQALCETRSFADLVWSKKALSYFHMVCSAVRGRAFFTTYRGIFGIGPEDIQQGDMVVILYGTRTPLILRRVDDKWRLIGDAYIHGLMDGEGLDADGFPFFIEHDFAIV
jgi:Heterokaryon incompatibility protein (HET)